MSQLGCCDNELIMVTKYSEDDVRKNKTRSSNIVLHLLDFIKSMFSSLGTTSSNLTQRILVSPVGLIPELSEPEPLNETNVFWSDTAIGKK